MHPCLQDISCSSNSWHHSPQQQFRLCCLKLEIHFQDVEKKKPLKLQSQAIQQQDASQFPQSLQNFLTVFQHKGKYRLPAESQGYAITQENTTGVRKAYKHLCQKSFLQNNLKMYCFPLTFKGISISFMRLFVLGRTSADQYHSNVDIC